MLLNTRFLRGSVATDLSRCDGFNGLSLGSLLLNSTAKALFHIAVHLVKSSQK